MAAILSRPQCVKSEILTQTVNFNTLSIDLKKIIFLDIIPHKGISRDTTILHYEYLYIFAN